MTFVNPTFSTRVEFPNGFTASVVSHDSLNGKFELALLRDGRLHLDNEVCQGDVVTGLTFADVALLLDNVGQLKPNGQF